MPKKYEIGQIVGGVTIIKKESCEKYNKYLLKCNTCGSTFIEYASSVKKHKNGCYNCNNIKKAKEKIEKEVGNTYNFLKILGYDVTRKKSIYVKCECIKCGSVVSMPITRVKNGYVKTCANCARKNLNKGHDLLKMSAVNGTSVICLQRHQNNKNNSSGFNGVNLCKSGRYRAYINFKRKHYHLGMYDTAEQAHEVRKIAESKIYGDFLEWYKKEYPDRWEKMHK